MMNKRQICLLIAALGTLSAMLVLSSAMAQPAIAQTPTPTKIYYVECAPWTQYVLPSIRTSASAWGTTSEGRTGYNTIDRIAYSTTIKGVYVEMFGYQTIPDGEGSNGMDIDVTDPGVRCTGSPCKWHVSDGVVDSYSGCSDSDSAACVAVGLTREWDLDITTFDNGWVDDGGGYQYGSGASFYSHVCVIHYDYVATYPECGVSITDTHFISNSWTTSGAFWYYSFYDISSGGSVRKNASFAEYGIGPYTVTVNARAPAEATLLVSAGGAAIPITISAGSTLSLYTGTVNVASLTPEVILQASGGMITVDRVCFYSGAFGALTGCINFDYHFMSPTSWTGGGGAEWMMNDPSSGTPSGIWRMEYGGYIAQSLALTGSGTYSVTARIKQLEAGPTTDLGILINGNEVGSLSYSSDSWSIVTTTLQLDPIYGELKLVPTGGTLIDLFCIEAGGIMGLGYPCGITAADVARSSLYISDSELELGVQFDIPGGTIGVPGIPLNFNVGGFPAYLLSHWQSFNASAWWMSLVGADVDGAYRVHNGGPALGLIPRAFVSTKQNLATNISGDYNVVMRLKPKYENAKMYVNGEAAPNGTYQSWSDAAVYVSGDAVEFTSDCGSILAGCTPQNGTIDVVEIDDVYVVPGPEITCGTTTPLTTTPGNCINPNPDFVLGSEDWELTGGAYIDSVYGWAILPGGSFIEQQVPTGGAWDQAATGINLGYSYVIAVGAHLEHSNAPGQFTVMVGASQPGQLSFNHELIDVTSIESTDMFTVTSDMLNGESLDIRIANEAGGTVMLDYVCIRYNGGPGILPPNGQCLGSWTTSDGSANAVGAEVPSNNYVKDVQASMGGGYALDLAGATDDEAGSSFTLEYCNATSGICDPIGTIPLDQNFSESFPFVVPSGGYFGGEMRLNNDDAVTYTNLCLRQSQNGPGGDTPSPPALPFPECGSVNNTASFYMMGPYSVTGEFTGTEYTAAYLSELMYNYSIYPLVCTTVSIGNWQYRAYAEFKALFNQYVAMMTAKLDYIIQILLAILDKIGTGGGDDTPWWLDLLNLLLLLLKMFLEILFKILVLIFQFLEKTIGVFGTLSDEVHGESGLMYPLSCGNGGEWMCFILGGIAELDWRLGDWLNIVSLIVVSMLTVSLVFWLVNQVRDMLQPGSGGDTSG
jgi:hypothetical protein